MTLTTRLSIYALRCVARLPLGVLYIGADIIYALLYHVVRYRRPAVDENLAECFPALDAAARRRIARSFYRNFADYIVETVKLLHISDREMARRMEFSGMEIIESLLDSGRDVTAYFAHCGNWEWVTSITMHSRHALTDTTYCQIYRPLNNRGFDRFMLALRSRFGSLSIAKTTSFRTLLMLRRSGRLTVTGFMSDQKPSHGDPTLPLIFLGRPTAFITGTETLARKMSNAAVYLDMHKPARGHYRVSVRLLSDDVSAEAPGSVTARYAAMLQETIQRNPSIWLWSHRRWKYAVLGTPAPLPKV